MTRKWNIVNDLLNANYGVRNEIIYNTEFLESNPFDYSNVYILKRGVITVTAVTATQVAFKNCAPFTKYITEIGGTIIDVAEDLDLVMPMHNLIEYSSNYSEITGTFWFYSKDKATNFNADIDNINNFKSFNYKAELLGNTVAIMEY